MTTPGRRINHRASSVPPSPARLLCSAHAAGRVLMAAATRMGGSAPSISPPPPAPSWHPVVLVPSHHHQQHQVLYDYDHDLATPSPTTTASRSPPRHNHLRPAARRAGKQRRPRPSRKLKLPTTYISADAASFRRMVHQVTGADDHVVHQHAATEVLLCRPAPAPPSRASLTTTATATLLPATLDTSAFLLGAARGSGARAGAGGGATPPARPDAGASCFHGSPSVAVGGPGAALQAEVGCGGGGGGVRGGGGPGEYSCSNGGGGFPSLELESWDDDNALF